MFEFFKKKRIEKYVRSAGNYVSFTFKPEPAKEKSSDVKFSDRGIRYSLSESPTDTKNTSDVRYSSQETDLDSGRLGGTRFSERYSLDDSIPNDGDSFLASSVQSFLKQNSGSPSLSKLASKLDSYLDLTFVDILTRYINEKGWRDSKVYKAAQMDRRLFSKIMSDRNYKPSKDTALSLVIALELSLKQTNDLLSRAGYTLSHSNKRDVIIEYFIREGIYNLSDINEVLYRLDQKIIGR